MKFKGKKCKRISRKKFDEIIISESFKRHPPKGKKVDFKMRNYLDGGKLDPIIVDENMMLIDGYCTYLIADMLKAPKRNFFSIYKVKV